MSCDLSICVGRIRKCWISKSVACYQSAMQARTGGLSDARRRKTGSVFDLIYLSPQVESVTSIAQYDSTTFICRNMNFQSENTKSTSAKGLYPPTILHILPRPVTYPLEVYSTSRRRPRNRGSPRSAEAPLIYGVTFPCAIPSSAHRPCCYASHSRLQHK